MDKLDVSVGLVFISQHLQSWIDFRMGCMRKGQPPFDDYNEDNLNIICPPTVWPTVGVLKNWISVLKQAKHDLDTPPQEQEWKTEAVLIFDDVVKMSPQRYKELEQAEAALMRQLVLMEKQRQARKQSAGD